MMHKNSQARAWRSGLRTGSLVATAWFALLGAGAGAARAAEQSPALAFVTGYRIGSNLPQLAMSVASQTQTYGILVAATGAARARDLVAQEISLLVPSYQARWDQNLASVYTKHFSTEELLSLTTQGPKSQYTVKLATLQPLIGNEMRETSQDLLMELLRQALQNALARTATRPTGSIAGEISF